MADIRHAIQMSATPEEVHTLVATAYGLKQWWAEDVTETDGLVDLGFFNRATIYRLRPAAGSASHVEWLCETGDQWAGTRLVFTLEPTANGTMLRFTHAGWAAETDYFISCTTTWGELMFRLK